MLFDISLGRLFFLIFSTCQVGCILIVFFTPYNNLQNNNLCRLSCHFFFRAIPLGFLKLLNRYISRNLLISDNTNNEQAAVREIGRDRVFLRPTKL